MMNKISYDMQYQFIFTMLDLAHPKRNFWLRHWEWA